MKNVFVEKLANLLKADTQEDRVAAQVELHHVVVSMKFTTDDISFETTTKNMFLKDVYEFVNHPSDLTRDLVYGYLYQLPSIIRD